MGSTETEDLVTFHHPANQIIIILWRPSILYAPQLQEYGRGSISSARTLICPQWRMLLLAHAPGQNPWCAQRNWPLANALALSSWWALASNPYLPWLKAGWSLGPEWGWSCLYPRCTWYTWIHIALAPTPCILRSSLEDFPWAGVPLTAHWDWYGKRCIASSRYSEWGTPDLRSPLCVPRGSNSLAWGDLED